MYDVGSTPVEMVVMLVGGVSDGVLWAKFLCVSCWSAVVCWVGGGGGFSMLILSTSDYFFHLFFLNLVRSLLTPLLPLDRILFLYQGMQWMVHWQKQF